MEINNSETQHYQQINNNNINNINNNINNIKNNDINNINNNINNIKNNEIIFDNSVLINLLNKYFNKNSKVYYKYKYVYARPTKCVGEFIETITNDGLETKNSTKSITDYIVKNTTVAKEQYILSSDDFNSRYELVDGNHDDSNYNNNNGSAGGINQDEFEWSLYKPKSSSQIRAIKINKKILVYLLNHYQQQNQQIGKLNFISRFINGFRLKKNLKYYRFYLVAQWSERMIFKEDDYLVIPINLAPNIYRIANKEFFETYKIY